MSKTYWFVEPLWVLLKTQNQQTNSELNKPVSFSHRNVCLIYVNETMHLHGHCLRIHVNHFMAWDDSPCANVISKCRYWVRGLVPLSEFRDISFL